MKPFKTLTHCPACGSELTRVTTDDTKVTYFLFWDIITPRTLTLLWCPHNYYHYNRRWHTKKH